MRYYISKDGRYGIVGNIKDALTNENAPEMGASAFKEVSEEEYENTVLDLRYENGEWGQ
jgi:hypothetical protein